MCTLCLSDMGVLRDEWLREPRKIAASKPDRDSDPPMPAASAGVALARLPVAKMRPATTGVPA